MSFVGVLNILSVTQREIKCLEIFGQSFEILIVVSQPAFTAGTKNSLLNATNREEAMQPWALCELFTTWFHQFPNLNLEFSKMFLSLSDYY
jgi:hypothetical protein